MEIGNRSQNLKNGIKEFLQWIEAIVIAVFIALLIRGYVFEPVLVQQMSMQDTLFEGQRLIVYKLGNQFSMPKRGDIIVFKFQDGIRSQASVMRNNPFIKKIIPDRSEVDYIKRVIALPGDSVDLKGGYVYVNGEKLKEPYVKGLTYKDSIEFPINKVPDNKVFVLGDNRENSSDSRRFGFIDRESIKGKAVLRIWPLNAFGGIDKK